MSITLVPKSKEGNLHVAETDKNFEMSSNGWDQIAGIWLIEQGLFYQKTGVFDTGNCPQCFCYGLKGMSCGQCNSVLVPIKTSYPVGINSIPMQIHLGIMQYLYSIWDPPYYQNTHVIRDLGVDQENFPTKKMKTQTN